MRPIKAYVVLAALLAAGCASSPEVAERSADRTGARCQLRNSKHRNYRS